MTEKEAQNQICNNNTLLTQLLRVDKSNNVDNVPSFLKKISEATKTQCKKWVSSAEYKAEDIISLNGIVYICKQDNINKNPSLFKNYWIQIVLPYASNKGKLKAYFIVRINPDNTLTILKSHNIEYITAYSSGSYLDFKIASVVNNLTQSVLTGFIQTTTTKLGVIEINGNPLSDKKIIRIKGIYSNNLGTIYASDTPIYTVCVYNTDNVVV